MQQEEKNKNYYEVLEIPFHCSADEIQQGYTRAKNAYAHDSLALYSLMSQEECESVLNLIEEAYTVLSDPDKRRQYDMAKGIRHEPAPGQMAAETLSSISSAEPAVTAAPTASQDDHQINPPRQTTGEYNMPKIVAKKRFALEFEVNQEMEDKIEQATEFNGALLREIREYKNVDINRMADLTRISKTYLRNIEEENLENLPALVYVRGFVYQFAKCLKLNPDLVASSYMHHIKKMSEN
jgi:curved DNA-binding protein CbpA